jgi:hypothetical protein
MRWLALLFLVASAVPAAAGDRPPAAECVFVLHGLARGAWSMAGLARRLSDAGFVVDNLDYPSTRASFPDLVSRLASRVDARAPTCATMHFVTFSMGGLVVRGYLDARRPERLGRVVMLGPPNHGTQLVDRLGGTWLFRTVFGAVATRLGTQSGSLPNTLGPPDYPLGIIAGDRAVNPVGWLLLPSPHDGTVSVASARLDGMTDVLIVHRSHTFMMRAPEVAAQTIAFLRHGRFERHASD